MQVFNQLMAHLSSHLHDFEFQVCIKYSCRFQIAHRYCHCGSTTYRTINFY